MAPKKKKPTKPTARTRKTKAVAEKPAPRKPRQKREGKKKSSKASPTAKAKPKKPRKTKTTKRKEPEDEDEELEEKIEDETTLKTPQDSPKHKKKSPKTSPIKVTPVKKSSGEKSPLGAVVQKLSPVKTKASGSLETQLAEMPISKHNQKLLDKLLPTVVQRLASEPKASEALQQIQESVSAKSEQPKPWYRRVYSGVKRYAAKAIAAIWKSPLATYLISIVILVIRNFLCGYLSRNQLIVNYIPDSPWYLQLYDAILRTESTGWLQTISSYSMKLVLSVGAAAILPTLALNVLTTLLPQIIQSIYHLLFRHSKTSSRIGLGFSILWGLLSTCLSQVKFESTTQGKSTTIGKEQIQAVQNIVLENPDITQKDLDEKLRFSSYSGTGTTWGG